MQLDADIAVVVISVTDQGEVVSLVTQMLPELSAAIPTGEEKEEEEEVKVVQEVEVQEEVAPGLISVTSEALSSVTQMFPELSAAIPAGVKFRVMTGQSEVVAQEVAPLGISITPSVTTTQTLLEGSTAMSLALVVVATETFDEEGGVKGVEGRELPPPPPPPPPPPQEERRRRAAREKEPKRRVTGVPPIQGLLRGRFLSRGRLKPFGSSSKERLFLSDNPSDTSSGADDESRRKFPGKIVKKFR